IAVRALAGERVADVVLDDVDLDDRSVAWVRSALATDLPAFFVLTARAAPVGLPALEIPLLPREAWRPLVDHLLPLSSVLADLVAERSGGSPRRAVQLVQTWVREGRLVAVKGEGLSLIGDATLDTSNADAALQLHPEGRIAVLLAAVQGRWDTRGWKQAAIAAGSSVPAELEHALSAAGFTEPTSGGWRFADGALRAALLAEARSTGALPDLHAAWLCVETTGEERAEHLAGSGRVDEAVELLQRAAEDAARTEPQRARRMLKRRHALLPVAGDPRRVEGLCELAALAGNFGDARASLRWAELAVAEAVDDRLAVLARLRCGTARIRLGEPGGRELLYEAMERSSSYPDLRVKVLRALGRHAIDPSQGLGWLEEAVQAPGLPRDLACAIHLDAAAAL
ncbi:MAG: hypothetical protein KC656_26515, partial [Myxococcales bacterium]|nr:hypothetical protein [Myxococcales bacterium]